MNLYWVRVIEERPISLALSERIGVQHQSPQGLLIKNGKAVWNDSHEQLTAENFKAAVNKA